MMRNRFPGILCGNFGGNGSKPLTIPNVIAGQGTAALELLGHVPDLDVLLGPHRRRGLVIRHVFGGSWPESQDPGLRV